MEIDQALLTLRTDRPVAEGGAQLRGAVAAYRPEELLLHQHSPGHGAVYEYPRVQYRVLDGVAMVLGLAEGADAVARLAAEPPRRLRLGGSRYKVAEATLKEHTARLGATARPLNYKLLSPWLALNQANFARYRKLGGDWRARKELLHSILVGNVLTFAKAFYYQVRRPLEAHSRLDPLEVSYKHTPMTAFTGLFRINFRLPELVGIGKGASSGFGTVLEEVAVTQKKRSAEPSAEPVT